MTLLLLNWQNFREISCVGGGGGWDFRRGYLDGIIY